MISTECQCLLCFINVSCSCLIRFHFYQYFAWSPVWKCYRISLFINYINYIPIKMLDFMYIFIGMRSSTIILHTNTWILHSSAFFALSCMNNHDIQFQLWLHSTSIQNYLFCDITTKDTLEYTIETAWNNDNSIGIPIESIDNAKEPTEYHWYWCSMKEPMESQWKEW